MALVLAGCAAAASAAPKAALFVQISRRPAGEPLGRVHDLVGARLTAAGLEVIRAQMSGVVESRDAESEQALRSRRDPPDGQGGRHRDVLPRRRPALRLAQMMGADYLVFASLISIGENRVNVQATARPSSRP